MTPAHVRVHTHVLQALADMLSVLDAGAHKCGIQTLDMLCVLFWIFPWGTLCYAIVAPLSLRSHTRTHTHTHTPSCTFYDSAISHNVAMIAAVVLMSTLSSFVVFVAGGPSGRSEYRQG